jgi:hypothetical protein
MVRNYEQKNSWRKGARTSEEDFEAILILACYGLSPSEISDNLQKPILGIRKSYDYIIGYIFSIDFSQVTERVAFRYVHQEFYEKIIYWRRFPFVDRDTFCKCCLDCPYYDSRFSNKFEEQLDGGNIDRDSLHHLLNKANCNVCPINSSSKDLLNSNSYAWIKLYGFMSRFYLKTIKNEFNGIINLLKISEQIKVYSDWVKFCTCKLIDNGVAIKSTEFYQFNMNCYIQIIVSNLNISLSYKNSGKIVWSPSDYFRDVTANMNINSKEYSQFLDRYDGLHEVRSLNSHRHRDKFHLFMYRRDYLEIINDGELFERRYI